MRLQAMVSIVLMVLFAFVSISGIQMHIPVHTDQDSHLELSSGSVERHIAGERGFADNFVLKRLHEWAGYLLIIFGLVHLIFNRKVMLAHISLRSKGGTVR